MKEDYNNIVVSTLNELNYLEEERKRDAKEVEMRTELEREVKAFKDSVNIDGIILTKLDGTAKGGVVYPIINDLNVPILFTGFGEGVDDLDVFNAESFVDKILLG